MNEFNQNLSTDLSTDKKSNRGGARPGAGRPKGSRDRVTVQGLLETLHIKTGGQTYEELLLDDFLSARLADDRMLTLKYHNLIMNKLVSDKVSIDVNESEDIIAARRLAFDQAVQSLSNVGGIATNIKIK
jgi:hypothetical protein